MKILILVVALVIATKEVSSKYSHRYGLSNSAGASHQKISAQWGDAKRDRNEEDESEMYLLDDDLFDFFE